MVTACAELRNLRAPAKLNLYLHVTGRKPDGYHELESVFDTIDWCDFIDLSSRDDGEVHFTMQGGNAELSLLAPEHNLCVRAANLLKLHTAQANLGVSIFLKKHLPSGAGLGGGSSDAATTLDGLNQLWGLGLSNLELRQIALKLGADVPYFLFGQSAYATGVGERLREIELPKLFYVVIYPGVGVPTASIFRSEKLTRDTKPVRILGSSPSVSKGFVRLPGRNDLQAVALGAHDAIGGALSLLGRFSNNARMSGSGSAVFAAFASLTEAQLVEEEVKQVMRSQKLAWLTKCCTQLGNRQAG